MHHVKSPDELDSRLSWALDCKMDTRIEIAEPEKTGKGRVVFTSSNQCIHLPLAGDSITWLKVRNAGSMKLNPDSCADGLFIELTGVSARIHIVELKKTVNLGKWDDIKSQFAGMVKQGLALVGVLGISVTEFVLYTAYWKDDLTPKETATIFAEKFELADNLSMPEQDWLDGAIDVLFIKGAKHVPIPCQLNGNEFFAEITI